MSVNLQSGTWINQRYHLMRPIGSGGMAHVWEANDNALQRVVALKFIHPNFAWSPDFQAKFSSEARALAALHSPNVVTIFDVSHFAGLPFLVMEYVAGPNLRNELRRLHTFTLSQTFEITKQILEALAVTHQHGIVHRDIKPENTLLRAPIAENPNTLPHVLLTDFGISQGPWASPRGTERILTPAYSAPEVLAGQASTFRSDIYSVGVMMYEMITGHIPFIGNDTTSTAQLVQKSDFPSLQASASWIPEHIDRLILNFSAKDPAQRPDSSTAALAKLHQVLSSLPEEVLGRRISYAEENLENTGASAKPAMFLPATHEIASATAVFTVQQPQKRKNFSWWKPVLSMAIVGALIGTGIAFFTPPPVI